MSKVVRVSDGNYKIVVPDGNSIILDSGETGLVEITGPISVPEIVVPDGQTTYDLLDSGVTTINFGGDATSISIGADTGITSVKNDLEVIGDLIIRGSSSEINSTTISVDDINIVLGSTETPTDITADGGGITLKGATDKTFNWVNATDSWTSSENIDLASSKTFKINNTDVLSSSGVLNSVASATGFTSATTLSLGAGSGTTTVNNNLSVNGGTLGSTQATFNLLNGSPTTVNFANAATTISMGAATGTTTVNNDLSINGGNLTTNQTTFNLLNVTPTTINFAGAATSLNLGAATGTTRIKNNLDVDGDLNIDGGDLTVSNATFNLANTNITTGNLFGSATTINIGSAGSSGTLTVKNDNVIIDGDLQVKGGDLTTNQTTFNLLNTTATTINFAGAANSLYVGSGSSVVTFNNDVSIVGALTVTGGYSETVDLSINQKILYLANVATITGLQATLTQGVATVTLTSGTTDNFTEGMDLTITGGTGEFGVGARVLSIQNSTDFTATVNHSTGGAVTFDVGPADDFTADTSGIIITGDTDKSIRWYRSTGRWTFNQPVEATSIQNTPIGSSVTASGAFTTLSATDVTTISANSNNPALKVTQTGAGHSFVVEDVNSDTTPFIITNIGDVGIGVSPSGSYKLEVDGSISGSSLALSVSTGTAPLTVSSTTKVTNLNADLLDDMNASSSNTVSTVVARDGSGDFAAGVITATRYVSNVATGTAPLTVASTTKVDNLNADLLDGLSSSTSNTVSTIVARDASGDFAAGVITATRYVSNVVTGTAPLTVASTTKVNNLNADLLDDMNASSSNTVSTIVARDASGDFAAGVITSSRLVSNIATGTAPLTVASTTKVTNLNADLLDDMNTSSSNTVSTIVARDANGDFAGRYITATTFYGSGAELTSIPQSAVTSLTSDLSAKAPTASPTFTGTATIPATSTSIIDTNTNAVAGYTYVIIANLTLTLPSGPSQGQTIRIINRSGLGGSTIGRNGVKIMGLDEDLLVNIPDAHFTLMYADSNRGWVIL